MRHDHFSMLPEQAFRTLGRRLLTLEGGGKGSAPKAPDYTGAAKATAAGNLEAARAATAANRVNQYTPYGNLIYTHTGTDPDNGWSATQTLSPTEQAVYDKTSAITQELLGTANTGLNFVNQTLSSGGKLDESKLAQSPIQGQAVQDAVMSRLQPQIAQGQESLRSRLAAQGISAGSEAYTNATREQTQKENDLYTQAALQGINTGLTARQQGIQEQYAAQDRPLNIVNALRTGAQVQSPNFVNVPQQATTQGADMLGAATAQGNFAQQTYANKQAANSGLWNAVGTVGSAYFL